MSTKPGGLALISLLLSACYISHPGDGATGPVFPDGPCDSDAAPYTAPRCATPGSCVDILFVVDNRESMIEEQVALFELVPELVVTLTSGDLDGDGAADFPAVQDLNFGAITADLGSGGTFVRGCLSPEFGDDGILGRGRTGRLSDTCGLDVPDFLRWGPDPPDDASAWTLDAACSVTMGIFGCTYAQPLEAGLKALTQSDAPPRFFRDSCGHADGANATFLRSDSLLVVFFVSDHDDCSVADPAFFADAAGRTEEPGLVCADGADALAPVGRNVEGFRRLRADPSDLVFVPVVGVPRELSAASDAADYDALLADPAMVQRPDPSDGSHLAPSCMADGRQQAFPPRRYVETARGLAAVGASAPVLSVCEMDLGAAAAAIAGRL